MDDELFFKTYSRDVYRYCLYMTQNKQDAEDLCQEVFVTALQQELHRIERPKAWLMRLALNQCRNYFARRKRGAAKEWLSYLLSRTNRGEQVEETFLRKETAVEFGKLYSKLPEKIRSVMTLCYINELSLQEAAEVLDVPLGTVKSRLHRGLSQLRQELDSPKNRHLKGDECYE
ncbi:RNA polymerase sigma factor [Paenibacillus turpanensis]|uniref:RNA polymerase sigma factor n=1 Tax=Paenibacillus turpanensis TaxID=2689078 RepID=UPI00140AC7FE|nr:RNA polymerase sigma factor [Paenibacillus turpanensis]